MTVSLVVLFSACFYQGESAYQIALRNGFIGTEQEWLDSLKGDKGEKGENGTNGVAGKDGANFNADYTATDLYNDALANGFVGDYMTFIKEVFGSDNTALNAQGLNKGLFSSCNVMCPYELISSVTGNPVQYTSGGAGIIYSLDKTTGDAIIVTNYHVVYRKSSSNENHINEVIQIYLYGDQYFQKPIDAEYVGGSADLDLAVLRVSASEQLKNSYCSQVEFFNSDALSLGETVVAIGNPQTSGTSVSTGTINVCSEYINIDNVLEQEVNMHVIRHDTPVNPGNSGGGLFNLKGQLVGLVNAKLAKENYENYCYAIPSNVVDLFTQNVLDFCLDSTNEKGCKPLFGIYVQTVDSTVSYDKETEKITVTEKIAVTGEVSGVSVGYFKDGDVLLSVTYDGATYSINGKHVVSNLQYKMRVGHKVKFEIERNGLPMNIEFVIPSGAMTYIN